MINQQSLIKNIVFKLEKSLGDQDVFVRMQSQTKDALDIRRNNLICAKDYRLSKY